MDLVVAVDVGKRADPTAVCVVERQRPRPPETDTNQWPTTWRVPGRETIYLVRELGRLRIGTKHTDGAYEVAKVCHDARCMDPDGSLTFLLDATGIGEALADLLERYLPTDVKLQKAWFTGSERMERVHGEYRVGKSWMISRLTSLIETGRVKFGDIPQRAGLVEELQAFEYHITAGGNYTADARSGAHDDLITCLGLATMMDNAPQAPRYRALPINERSSSMPADGDDWEELHSSRGLW